MTNEYEYETAPAPDPLVGLKPPFFTRTMQEMCEHCFCERSGLKEDHARCCKCTDEMHDKFVVIP